MYFDGNRLVMRKPDNWHNHLRYGELMRALLIYTLSQFQRSNAMGNLKEMPITTAALARMYRDEVNAFASQLGYPSFECLVSMLLTPQTTDAMIEEAVDSVMALKVYPFMGTTNSHLGIPDFLDLEFIARLRTAARCKIPVQFHAEVPGGKYPQGFREAPCAPMMQKIRDLVPDLIMIVEHLSTRVMRDVILRNPGGMFASIAPQHIYETRESASLDRHLCCMPFPGTPDDRDALREAVLSGNPQFFYGSDNAPHLEEDKNRLNPDGTPNPAFGVCTAPVELPVMAQFFIDHDQINGMEPFMSEFGARAYDLPLNTESIALIREDWSVPQLTGGVVPYRYGQTLHWKVDTARAET